MHGSGLWGLANTAAGPDANAALPVHARGEIVRDVPPPLGLGTPLLLVKPPVGLSTPAIFK